MKKTLFCLCLACVVGSASEFVNVTFDDPDLRNVVTLEIPWTQVRRQYAPVEEALRGWTVSQPMSDFLQYSYSQGRISVGSGVSPLSLSGMNSGANTPPYVVKVSSDLIPGGPVVERPAFRLSQAGRVPESAASLRFYNSQGSLEPVFVFINGLEANAVNFDLNPRLFEVDVLAFAGQEVELSFMFPEGQGHLFDIIGFQAIPEPKPAALLVVGGALLLAGRRRRKQLTGRRTGRDMARGQPLI